MPARWITPLMCVLLLGAACGAGRSLPSSDDPTPTGPPATGSPAASTPLEAPAGRRWVGIGRIAVAVPAGWATNALRCGVPLADTVAFPSDAIRGCLVPARPRVSSVSIASTNTSVGADWLGVTAASAEVDGITVRRVPTVGQAFPGAHVTGALIVESEHAAIWASSQDTGRVDRILGSMIVIPEGYVTIPFNPNAPLTTSIARMRDAGLKIRVTVRPRHGWSPGSLRRSQPALGSVVAVGSVVRLTTT